MRTKNELDKAIKNIEQGNAWDESDEVVQVGVKKPLDKVIPVRLSADKWEELRREARELGVGPNHTGSHVALRTPAPAGEGLTEPLASLKNDFLSQYQVTNEEVRLAQKQKWLNSPRHRDNTVL